MMAKDPTFKFGKKEHLEKAPEVDLTPYVVEARCEVPFASSIAGLQISGSTFQSSNSISRELELTK